MNRKDIKIIIYEPARPMTETIESLEEWSGLIAPDQNVRYDQIVSPVKLEEIGVLITYEDAIRLESDPESMLGHILEKTARSRLPADWIAYDKQNRLYTTNAGYLVIFSRQIWSMETIDLDLSIFGQRGSV